MTARAYTPETVPNPRLRDACAYVANPDGVLTIEEVQQLQEISEKIYSICEAEVCVVAVNDIEGYEAADFSVRLFNNWGIGSKKNNTGVLVLLAVYSRDIHITTGAGIEGVLTDYRCNAIIDDAIGALGSDRFGEGLAIISKRIGEKTCSEDAKAELLLGFVPKDTSGEPWNILSLLSFIVGMGYLAVYLSKPKCTKCQERELKLLKKTVRVLPTYTSKGKGESTYVCKHCGATVILPYTIAMLVHHDNIGGGGGGFYGGYHSGGRRGGFGGGFGGGSFGGGFSLGGGAGRKF